MKAFKKVTGAGSAAIKGTAKAGTGAVKGTAKVTTGAVKGTAKMTTGAVKGTGNMAMKGARGVGGGLAHVGSMGANAVGLGNTVDEEVVVADEELLQEPRTWGEILVAAEKRASDIPEDAEVQEETVELKFGKPIPRVKRDLMYQAKLTGFVVAAVLVAWLLGWLGFSILFAPLLAGAVYFSDKRVRTKYIQNTVDELVRIMRRQDLHLRERESVEWINVFIERFWKTCTKQLAADVRTQVKAEIKKTMEMNKPPGVGYLKITELLFGDIPPRLDNFKVFPDLENPAHYQIDVDIEYLGDASCSILLGVGVGIASVPMPVKIDEIRVKGRLRAQVILDTKEPWLDAVGASFLYAPLVDVAVKPLKSLDVLDTPMLKTWIDGLVGDIVGDLMVLPNRIVIDMNAMAMNSKKLFEEEVERVKKLEDDARAAGLEVVDSKMPHMARSKAEAKKLAKEAGTATAQLGKAAKDAKKSVAKDSNKGGDAVDAPVKVPTDGDELAKLADEATVGEPKVDPTELTEAEKKENEELEKMQKEKAKEPSSPRSKFNKFKSIGRGSSKGGSKKGGSSMRKSKKVQIGHLRIKVESATGLPISDKSTQSSDPYCKLKLGHTKVKTHRKKKTLNPEWDEMFEMPVYASTDKALSISVWDADKMSGDDKLCVAEFDFSGVGDSDFEPHTIKLTNVTGGDGGELKVSALFVLM